MKLKFAFAVDKEEKFKNSHFGDADHYIIYEVRNDKMEKVAVIENKNRDHDESTVEQHKGKGRAITQVLKKEGVNVLVSRQFGKNIAIVSQSFIPVLVSNQQPDEAFDLLNKHVEMMREELNREAERFHLFSMKSGELKIVPIRSVD